MTGPGKLIYVVGPSGAGKDALLEHARANLPADTKVTFARRWITRSADAGGEAHRALTSAEFERKLRIGARTAMAMASTPRSATGCAQGPPLWSAARGRICRRR